MSGTKKKFLAVQKALKKTPLHFFSVSFGPEKMVKVDKKKGLMLYSAKLEIRVTEHKITPW